MPPILAERAAAAYSLSAVFGERGAAIADRIVHPPEIFAVTAAGHAAIPRRTATNEEKP